MRVFINVSFLWVVAAALVAIFGASAAAADGVRFCRDSALEVTVSAAAQGRLGVDALKSLMSRFDGHEAATATCVRSAAFCIGREIALADVDKAFDKLSENPPDVEGARSTLESGKKSGQPWQLLALLGDLEANLARQEHDPSNYRDAAANLQSALNEIEGYPLCEGFSEKQPSDHEIEGIRKRAQEAVMLAPTFQIARTKQGDCGGIFLSKVRGINVESIPVPIKFAYDRADFTTEGQQAAQGLLQCINEKHLPRVILTGHTDAHGSDGYNMELSRRRLKTVGDFMKAGGYSGALILIPMGKRDQFKPDDPTQHSRDEIDEMNRRVELRETAP